MSSASGQATPISTPKGINLQPGEQIVMVVRPTPFVWGRLYMAYLFTLGLTEFWRRRHRLTITDQRVITSAGVLSRHVRVLPRTRIQDVNLHNKLWRASLLFSSAGGTAGSLAFVPLRTRDARQVVDLLSGDMARNANAGL